MRERKDSREKISVHTYLLHPIRTLDYSLLRWTWIRGDWQIGKTIPSVLKSGGLQVTIISLDFFLCMPEKMSFNFPSRVFLRIVWNLLEFLRSYVVCICWEAVINYLPIISRAIQRQKKNLTEAMLFVYLLLFIILFAVLPFPSIKNNKKKNKKKTTQVSASVSLLY